MCVVWALLLAVLYWGINLTTQCLQQKFSGLPWLWIRMITGPVVVVLAVPSVMKRSWNMESPTAFTVLFLLWMYALGPTYMFLWDIADRMIGGKEFEGSVIARIPTWMALTIAFPFSTTLISFYDFTPLSPLLATVGVWIVSTWIARSATPDRAGE